MKNTQFKFYVYHLAYDGSTMRASFTNVHDAAKQFTDARDCGKWVYVRAYNDYRTIAEWGDR